MGRLQSQLGTAVFAAFCIAFAAMAQEPALVADAPKDYVTDILPYPIDDVYERAQSLFDSSRRDYYEDYNPAIYALPEPVASFKSLSPEGKRKFFALPLVKPNKFYVFFGAYPTMQYELTALDPLAAIGHPNPALARYASLPASARNYDLYIWSPDTPYWYSEYQVDGQPVPFKSYFIVHLTAEGSAHTRVEVIENEPRIYMGHRMSVDVHGKVHDDDVREVAPTTRDREFLLSCLSQCIERHVPGRHWFNCREKGEVVETPIPFTVP